MLLVLHLAQHNLVLLTAAPQRQQKVTIEPGQESIDRRGIDHVESDHPHVGLDQGRHHAGDVAGPHRLGRVGKA